MAKPMSWGPSRTGFYDAVRGANLVQEDAFKSKPNPATDSGVEEFKEGEWATVGATGLAEKITGTLAATSAAYPNVVGYERADFRGSKSATLALGIGFWVETSGWEQVTKTADDFPAGTECTIKDGVLYPAVSTNVVVAIVRRAAQNAPTQAQKALQKTAFTTLLVEIVRYVKP